MTETSDPLWNNGEDARQYDEFTRMIFAAIYPVIADQVLERTGITTGTCLDLGSGPAPLALALALLSDLRVTALDCSPEMFVLAIKNIRKNHLEDRVIPVLGDVHAIPAADATFDLVVSRGSYHSWASLPEAFLEILRVLKQGGMAYIGGGYGSARIRNEVLSAMKTRRIAGDPDCPAWTRFRRVAPEEIAGSAESAGIRNYRIISDDSGLWVVFRKM
ncbi:class I SAM-dependent methyltransferase [Methanoregula sp.]|uniref:class I SAM-dependent methyltransferase n=1 Tax=Methanoregula sp. TaxID=2052170 RepID=UPI00356A9377